MESIVNFINSENYYFSLYIFSMIINLFILIFRGKSIKNTGEYISYIDYLKQLIIISNPEKGYKKTQTLAQLIRSLIGIIEYNKIKFKEAENEIENREKKFEESLRRFEDMEKENFRLKEEIKIIDKVRAENTMMRKRAKTRRKNMCSLYSQLQYRNELLEKNGIKIKKVESKYCKKQ